MTKSSFLSVILLAVSFAAAAQAYDELGLLYARNTVAGTARTMGVAGAFSSVGADIGSMATNPAGLGLFRATDISATPGLLVAYNKANYQNTLTNASFAGVYLGQAGLAFTKILNKASSANDISFTSHNVRSFTIAFNYQRQSFFSGRTEFVGNTNAYSNASRYADNLNNTTDPIDFNYYPAEMVLLYDLGVLHYDTSDGLFHQPISLPAKQSGTLTTKGANDVIDLAFGLNINDKAYIGMGVGIPLLSYSNSFDFTETAGVAADTFNSYALSSMLSVRGFGVNAKLGFIYRPAPWMRFGVSYQIPTFYSISDNYEVDADASTDTSYNTTGVKYEPFHYKFRSPMKGTAGVSFFIKQHAFISVDYELSNYGASRYNFGKDFQDFSSSENKIFKDKYAFAHTLRVGAEGAIKWFRIRAGYSFSSSPYKKDYVSKGFSNSLHLVTVGLGYRGKKFYADFAYLYSLNKNSASLLALDPVQNQATANRAVLTLGWRFSR